MEYKRKQERMCATKMRVFGENLNLRLAVLLSGGPSLNPLAGRTHWQRAGPPYAAQAMVWL